MLLIFMFKMDFETVLLKKSVTVLKHECRIDLRRKQRKKPGALPFQSNPATVLKQEMEPGLKGEQWLLPHIRVWSV